MAEQHEILYPLPPSLHLLHTEDEQGEQRLSFVFIQKRTLQGDAAKCAGYLQQFAPVYVCDSRDIRSMIPLSDYTAGLRPFRPLAPSTISVQTSRLNSLVRALNKLTDPEAMKTCKEQIASLYSILRPYGIARPDCLDVAMKPTDPFELKAWNMAELYVESGMTIERIASSPPTADAGEEDRKMHEAVLRYMQEIAATEKPSAATEKLLDQIMARRGERRM